MARMDVPDFLRRLLAPGSGGMILALSLGMGCEEVSDPGRGSTALQEPGPEVEVLVEPLDDRRLDLGLQLLERGGYPEAQVAFEAVITDRPDHPRPRFLRAIAVQKQGNYAVALKELDGLASNPLGFPGKDSVDHFRGWCLFYLGRPREAATAFETHLAAEPGSADSAFGHGVSLLELGRPDAALEALNLALDIETKGRNRRRSVGKTWIRRGDALWELGRIEEATHSFHKGVIQFPDHYEGWAKLGRGHERLGDQDKVDWARREERHARSRVGAPLEDEAGETVGDG